MRRKNVPLWPIVLIFLFSPAAVLSAEEILLKNGDRLTGILWSLTAQRLLVDTPHGLYWLERRHLQEIRLLGRRRVRFLLRGGVGGEGIVQAADRNGVRIVTSSEPVLAPWADIEEIRFFEDSREKDGTNPPPAS